ncbi:hypothetical protein K438DRAFT_1963037 [Mycena galopus ATCC 62051]|nr:hypothetical protein K438DRAFT_1963037 [Mycena galopus ATCC 62051]
MVSWSDLSRCTNSDCPFKGSCRKFCPPIPLGDVEEQIILLALCVCTCRGMQHEAGPLDAPATSTSTPAGNRPPPPAAPGLGGGFSSVGDASRARKAKMNAHLMEDFKVNVLDPTSKVHQDAWAKLSSRPDAKRKKPPSASAEPLPKRKAPAPTPESVELTLVLVEDTKAVNQGQYLLPTATKMRDLHRLGYIKAVSFEGMISAADVSRLVPEAFESTFESAPALKQRAADLLLWRLLCIRSITNGKKSQLLPHALAVPKVTLQDLKMASASHRQAKEFKKCVYIALSRSAGNLPYDESDNGAMASDGTEYFPDSIPPSPSKPAPTTPPSPGPSAGPSTRQKSPHYGAGTYMLIVRSI